MAPQPLTTVARFRRSNAAVLIAATALGFLAALSVSAPILIAADPLAINPSQVLASPDLVHPLGTDELGRDLLARVVYGGRVSLTVAAAAVLIAGTLGVISGVAIAFFSPRLESAMMRIIDVLVSLPEIFVAIVVLAFLGGSFWALIGTIGVLYFPQFARVAYGMARSIRARDHVTAAVSLGAGPVLADPPGNPAQHALGDRRPGVLHFLLRDAAGGGPELPRARRPSSDPVVGPDDRHPEGLHLHQSMAGSGAEHRSVRGGAVDQRPRRLAAGSPQSELRR